MFQRTITSPIEISGKGLHTGKPINMHITEGREGSGILFQRADLAGRPVIRAQIGKVINVDRCTMIGDERMKVGTIEHFLAAVYGLGIDNLKVILDGEELPSMDGSARLFCEYILAAGIKEQGKERKIYTIKAPQFVSRPNAVLIALPSDTLKLTGLFEFPHPQVVTQVFDIVIEPGRFTAELAPARTFGFWEEVKALWERNLALGGDYENALVIRQDGYSSPLRFSNELVRHKCLDLLGDLALSGKSMHAHLISLRAGHSLNIELIKKLKLVEVKDVRN